jgi:hypothetical protein
LTIIIHLIFYAKYNEDEAIVDINDLKVISGRLPSRALGMVIEWANLHHKELIVNWDKAANLEEINKIDPLR